MVDPPALALDHRRRVARRKHVDRWVHFLLLEGEFSRDVTPVHHTPIAPLAMLLDDVPQQLAMLLHVFFPLRAGRLTHLISAAHPCRHWAEAATTPPQLRHHGTGEAPKLSEIHFPKSPLHVERPTSDHKSQPRTGHTREPDPTHNELKHTITRKTATHERNPDTPAHAHTHTHTPTPTPPPTSIPGLRLGQIFIPVFSRYKFRII